MAPFYLGLFGAVLTPGIGLTYAAVNLGDSPLALSFLAGGTVTALGAIMAGGGLALALRFLRFSEASRRIAAALPAALICAFALLALMETLPLEGIFVWIATGFVGTYVIALGRVLLFWIVWLVSAPIRWLQGTAAESRRVGSVFQELRRAFGIEVVLVSLAAIILALVIMSP